MSVIAEIKYRWNSPLGSVIERGDGEGKETEMRTTGEAGEQDGGDSGYVGGYRVALVMNGNDDGKETRKSVDMIRTREE